jgi:hypothetical protein
MGRRRRFSARHGEDSLRFATSRLARHALIAALLLAAGGCVSTSEMPLAKNAVRIDTTGEGLIGQIESERHTLRRAAQLTLEAGYQRFILTDRSKSESVDIVGYTPGQATTNVTTKGGATVATTTYAPPQPIRVDHTRVGVTVRMLNPGDPGFDDAIDAAEELKRLNG